MVPLSLWRLLDFRPKSLQFSGEKTKNIKPIDTVVDKNSRSPIIVFEHDNYSPQKLHEVDGSWFENDFKWNIEPLGVIWILIVLVFLAESRYSIASSSCQGNHSFKIEKK